MKVDHARCVGCIIHTAGPAQQVNCWLVPAVEIHGLAVRIEEAPLEVYFRDGTVTQPAGVCTAIWLCIIRRFPQLFSRNPTANKALSMPRGDWSRRFIFIPISGNEVKR